MPDLFCDGGCIRTNPSTIGGTYAWLLVETPDCDDPDCHRDPLRCDRGQIVQSGSGLILVRGVEPAPLGAYLVDEPVSNNLAEFVAATLALRAMRQGWSGRLCSDSRVTLGRLFEGWALTGIPRWWVSQARDALARLDVVGYTLLQGHPTKADLAAGIGAKRNLPVSRHNVWCDERCQEVARNYLAKRQEVEA